MKTNKNTLILTMLLLIAIGTLKAQITKPPVSRPGVKPPVNVPVDLPSSYDEIIRGLKQEHCYEIALVNLQSKYKDRSTLLLDGRVMHGIGSLKLGNKRLEASLPLESEYKYPKKLSTTILILPQKKGIRMTIRNSEFNHLFYEKMEKQDNGSYYITGQKEFNNESDYFTLVIYRVDCLI